MQKKRLVGIDYGTKRIGLAVADPLRIFARPVGTFSREGLQGALEEIERQDGIATLVVGYPLSSGGETNAMTGVIDRFITELGEAFPDVAIERVDEYHSSREAVHILAAAGGSRKDRQKRGGSTRQPPACCSPVTLKKAPEACKCAVFRVAFPAWLVYLTDENLP